MPTIVNGPSSSWLPDQTGFLSPGLLEVRAHGPGWTQWCTWCSLWCLSQSLSCIDSHPNGQTWTSFLKHEIIGCLYPAGNKTIQPQLEPFFSKVDAFVPHLTEQKLTPHSQHWPHTTHSAYCTWTYSFWYVIHRLLLCTYVFKLLHAGNQRPVICLFH